MNTGSAATRATVAQAWAPVLRSAGAQAQELGEQLLAVAHEIITASLSGPLTDPGRSGEDKAALAARVFSGRVDDRVVELLSALVRGRWSKPTHLVSSVHDLGLEAILAGARSAGHLDDVEQELFAVGRLLDSDSELRVALEPSRRTTTEGRVLLAQRIFGSQLSDSALSLLTWCVRHRDEGGVPRNLRRVVEMAAAMQGRVVADVVTAVPMTTAQEERLRALLAQRLGSEIELNTVLDPAVIGGVHVKVRDLVIDSTVRSSIDAVRTTLAG